jgi:hypothetical protein
MSDTILDAPDYNSYESLEALRSLTQIRRTPINGTSHLYVDCLQYNKLIWSGSQDYGSSDYGVGAYNLCITPYYNPSLDPTSKAKGPSTGKGDCWMVRAAFHTIDDGGYGGCTQYTTKEKCLAQIENIVNELLPLLDKLTTVEEVNGLFQPFGLVIASEV